MPKNELWKYLNNLYEKNIPITTESAFKDYFIVIRFLSLYPPAFYAAVQANRLSGKNVPSWMIGVLLYNLVPKEIKAPWRKYIKADIEKLSDKRKKAIRKVGQLFNCSDYHAQQTLWLLEKQGFHLEGS